MTHRVGCPTAESAEAVKKARDVRLITALPSSVATCRHCVQCLMTVHGSLVTDPCKRKEGQEPLCCQALYEESLGNIVMTQNAAQKHLGPDVKASEEDQLSACRQKVDRDTAHS